MRRETAYKLAGRNHAHPVAGAGLVKEREIRFAAFPPEQTAQAYQSLRMVKDLQVREGDKPRLLVVRYSVLDHCLEDIESALVDAGFHLSSGLYAKLTRALIYFCEETQRHNLLSPERLIKKSNEVYVKVYDYHPHGDHDETPPDLRDYK